MGGLDLGQCRARLAMVRQFGLSALHQIAGGRADQGIILAVHHDHYAVTSGRSQNPQQGRIVLVVVRAIGRIYLDRRDARGGEINHPAIQFGVGRQGSQHHVQAIVDLCQRADLGQAGGEGLLTSWPGNCVAKSMTVVTPPQAAVRVPISQLSGVW